MNQQDIFQNMTKGELPLPVGTPLNRLGTKHLADEYAKVIAFNNTYRKGINPEGVERLKKLAETVYRYYTDEEYHHYWNTGAEENNLAMTFHEWMLKETYEALTAAKLSI